jgi:hypothetical protein
MSDSEVYVSTHGDGPKIDDSLEKAVTAIQPDQALIDSMYDRTVTLQAQAELVSAYLKIISGT